MSSSHSLYLRGEHVLGQVEGEGAGRSPGALAREAAVLQSAGPRHGGQQVAHAHGREGSGGHGKLPGVEEERRARAEGVEELLAVQAGQSQTLQVTRAEVRGALGLDHERREGVLGGTHGPRGGLRVLCQSVRGVLPVSAVRLVLLQVPYAENGLVLLVGARSAVPDALLAPGAVGGHGFGSRAVGTGAEIVVMLQLLFAVAAVLVICETDGLCVIYVKAVVEVWAEVRVEGIKNQDKTVYFQGIY